MEEIIKLMVGRELTNRFPPKTNKPGDVILDVQHIAGKYTRRKDATFQLRKGEVLGIAGLDGSGRTEVLENLFGAMTREGGTITLHGKEIQNRTPKESIKNGFALLTEERRATGIFGIRDIRENTVISSLKDYLMGGICLSDKQMKEKTEWAIQAMHIKTPTQKTQIRSLSGGNQQKDIIGRWLLTKPEVLLLDAPTNDLDVMTLSILEDYLQGFPGPILIVSHDRFLLDKLAEQVFEVRDGEVLRYSGNWSDWKAKRKEEEAPAKAEKPKAAQERPRERKLKFSFKEQREFETIDEDLAALEQQIRECEEAQGACGSDFVHLQELQAIQAELEAALEEKTERWMYLTELKEKIDAQ